MNPKYDKLAMLAIQVAISTAVCAGGGLWGWHERGIYDARHAPASVAVMTGEATSGLTLTQTIPDYGPAVKCWASTGKGYLVPCIIPKRATIVMHHGTDFCKEHPTADPCRDITSGGMGWRDCRQTGECSESGDGEMDFHLNRATP